MKNLLHEFWNRHSDACPVEASVQEQQENEWQDFIQDKEVIYSRFDIGDKIGLELLINLFNEARDGEITGITLLKGKVKYNIAISAAGKTVRFSNIDAAFVKEPERNGFHYNSNVAKVSRESLSFELSREGPASDFKGPYSCKDEFPPLVPDLDDLSETVAIDVNGNMKDWDFGWYNFTSKEWCMQNRDFERSFELEHAKWFAPPKPR